MVGWVIQGGMGHIGVESGVGHVGVGWGGVGRVCHGGVGHNRASWL